MRSVIALFAAATMLAAGACVLPGQADEPEAVPVRVGTGPETEATLVAEIFAELLRARDVPAEVTSFGDLGDARQAIELGDVDVVPGYTGAVWLDELRWSDPPGSPETSYERVSRADASKGLVWLPATQVNATFAFVIPGTPATAASMTNNADLALAVNQAVSGEPAPGSAVATREPENARLCVDEQFAERSDGLEAFARLYSLRREVLRDQLRITDPEAAVTAVATGRCLAGLTTATDGQAWVRGLRPLRDDLKIFPAFVLAPVVRESFHESRPEAVEALRLFGPEVTTARMAAWNGRVVAGEETTAVAVDAAEELLAEHAEAGD